MSKTYIWDDRLFTQMLEDLSKLNDLAEDGSGLVVITEDDIEDMEKMLEDRTESFDPKTLQATKDIIARVRSELDHESGYAAYFCY